MAINIYLKNNNQYERLARVDKTPTTITGSIWHIFPPDRLTGLKDIHFTYPADGNYHISTSMTDGTEVKIFFDRGARKRLGASWGRISKEDARGMIPVAMVPDFKPIPLAEYATTDNSSFHIVTMGMGRFDFSDTEVPQAGDFVIDCINVDIKRTPNFVLMIIGKNCDPYANTELEIIDKGIFFDAYPKVFAGLFYGH
jgi:hypothetical protein